MDINLSNTVMAGIQTVAGLGLVAMGFLLAQRLNRIYGDNARRKADELLLTTRKEADVIIRAARTEAKETVHQATHDAEEALRRERAEMRQFAERFIEREQGLEKKSLALERREAELDQARQQLQEQQRVAARQSSDAEKLFSDARQQALRVAAMSPGEARATLLEEERHRIAAEVAALEAAALTDARANAAREARKLVVTAIERCAAQVTGDATTTMVALPSEEMKGRLIGKEGRNFRAFEQLTGVNLIIDETPGAVLVSSHDPMRRDIARLALERLVADGRIHPGRIEEEVQRARAEVDDGARIAGEAAFHTLNLTPAAPEVVATLGRLKHRQSWHQNVLDHSIEMAGIMGTLAGELGLDITAARRIGLLHDIGKALSAEEGPHATAGAALLKRHGERDEIVHAVAAHHREVEPASLLAHLAIAADAITASRPGARTDQTRMYFERMGQLEQIAQAVPGVDHTFAIHGGRELRVFVNAAALDDQAAADAAREIAARIRDNVAFPGQIRVVVVRETRCIEQVRQGHS